MAVRHIWIERRRYIFKDLHGCVASFEQCQGDYESWVLGSMKSMGLPEFFVVSFGTNLHCCICSGVPSLPALHWRSEQV